MSSAKKLTQAALKLARENPAFGRALLAEAPHLKQAARPKTWVMTGRTFQNKDLIQDIWDGRAIWDGELKRWLGYVGGGNAFNQHLVDLRRAGVKVVIVPGLLERGEPIPDDVKVAADKWKKLPKGWTDESRKKFWDSLTSRAPKHKVTECIKRMGKHMDNPGAFCASLADRVTPGWREEAKKASQPLQMRRDYGSSGADPWLSLEEVRTMCPSCADKMARNNLRAVKASVLRTAMRVQRGKEAMAKSAGFGTSESLGASLNRVAEMFAQNVLNAFVRVFRDQTKQDALPMGRGTVGLFQGDTLDPKTRLSISPGDDPKVLIVRQDGLKPQQVKVTLQDRWTPADAARAIFDQIVAPAWAR